MSLRSAAASLLPALCLAILPWEAGAQPAAEPATLIHAGWLLAVPGTEPRPKATIIVRQGRVEAVRDGFASAADLGLPGETRVIDLTGAFVLPGLIDTHVHLTTEVSPRFMLETVTLDPEHEALSGVQYAERTLQAGFTTVRDLGASARTSLALRDAISAGKVPGPTILAAGRMISATAGHGDANGWNEVVTHAKDTAHVCNGVDDCRRAVREQVRKGADVIKFATTGGVMSQIAAGTGQQMFDDEIRAIVETGHLMGKKVAAHAHGTAGINAALRAGVDSIEHGSYLDDESIRLFRQTGAYLVPTLLAGASVVDMARQPGAMSAAVRDKALAVGAVMQQNFSRAHKAGVRIAFGTDSGVSRHGQNARELKLMVDAGMSPADAIRAATVNAADLLQQSAEIGTIEPGKRADLIATAASPLDDITELERVTFVMRRGVVHRLDGRRQPFPPEP